MRDIKIASGHSTTYLFLYSTKERKKERKKGGGKFLPFLAFSFLSLLFLRFYANSLLALSGAISLRKLGLTACPVSRAGTDSAGSDLLRRSRPVLFFFSSLFFAHIRSSYREMGLASGFEAGCWDVQLRHACVSRGHL